MKKHVNLVLLMVLCSLFMGSFGTGCSISLKTDKQTKNQEDEILYYSIEEEEITFGLPYEWNTVYPGMHKIHP